MNYARIAIAALSGFVAYMVLGGLMFAAIPSLKDEFQKYPGVYRSPEGQMSHLPVGIAAMVVSVAVLAVLYAMVYKPGSGCSKGALFGALIGVYSIGSFVVHNYVNLNIGLNLTLFSAAASMIQWTVVGIVIARIYRPIS